MINLSLTQYEHYLLIKALRNEIDNTNDGLRTYEDSEDRKYLNKLQDLYTKITEGE
jgi:hypothetical protein